MDDEVDIRTTIGTALATVRTEVELNWFALGEHFLRASSEHQARFLLGWEAEADVLGYLPEDTQYLYIADDIPHDHVRRSIAERLRRLADFLHHMAAVGDDQ